MRLYDQYGRLPPELSAISAVLDLWEKKELEEYARDKQFFRLITPIMDPIGRPISSGPGEKIKIDMEWKLP